MAEFSDMLTFLRKRSGLTQAELSKRTGLSRSSIANYESGLRRPNDDDKEVLADFFNVSMDTLLGRSSERKEQTTVLGDLSPLEIEFIQAIRQLPDDSAQQFLALVKTLSKRP